MTASRLSGGPVAAAPGTGNATGDGTGNATGDGTRHGTGDGTRHGTGEGPATLVDRPEAGRQRARLKLESSVLGIGAVVAPPLVLVSFLFVGFIARDPARLLTVALEAAVPLAVGLATASLLASEPALELQLATPGGFRPAALRRAGLLFGWAALLSLVTVLIGRAAGTFDSWPGPADPLRDLLMWLSPLSLFAAWGCVLGIALRSRGAAAALLTGFWIAGLALKDWFLAHDFARAWFPFMVTFSPDDPSLLANRLTVLALAAIGLAVAVVWLGRGEWLLGSEDR